MVRVRTAGRISTLVQHLTKQKTYCWKASVNVFTATQALTNRSNVIPTGGPYPVAGADATHIPSERNLKGGGNPQADDSPYFCSISIKMGGERLYPKLRRASDNSRPSMVPDWSLSKCLKTPCQSAMYFQSPENSIQEHLLVID